MLFISGGDRPVMLEFGEEPLDPVAAFVRVPVERERCRAARHRFDHRLCPHVGQPFTQPVTVICRVGQQSLTGADRAEHIVGGTTVMGLSGGEFQRDRQAVRIRDSVDFGRQTAP